MYEISYFQMEREVIAMRKMLDEKVAEKKSQQEQADGALLLQLLAKK